MKYIHCPKCGYKIAIDKNFRLVDEKNSVFIKIDNIINRINKYKTEPLLSTEIKDREKRTPKEFNHSRKFWNLVAKTAPDYLEIRNELKRSEIKFI